MLWIAALAGLAYLPSALQLTYYRDDWYYAYDAMVGPSGVFRYMFAQDRPARGPFFDLYHVLFGIAPTPYHLAMLFWRIVGGIAVVWLFHLLWRNRHVAGLMAGALFALYPGFTWWVQGIEYQPMVASAALTVVSLCLTLLAIRQRLAWARILCMAGAMLTGWLYLALVEYAAGMELLRLALIYAAVDARRLRDFRSRALAALRVWLPYLIVPLGFALWRFVFFSSARKATDLGAQLSALFSHPLSTALHWLMSFLLSLFNVTIAAWIQPLQEGFFSLRLREQLPGLGLAVVAGVLVWLLLRNDEARPARRQASADDHWQLQAISLGFAGLILGILPVIAANRQITLPSFSHYALPASSGLAFLVVGIVGLLAERRAQIAVFVFLATLSVLILQGLGAAALREERTIANFWHQMAWRAPSIDPGTALIVYYPGVDYGSDSDVVWGPGNFIYFPEPQNQLPVRVQLAALSSSAEKWNVLLYQQPLETTYRSHTMTLDYSKVLLAAQSSPDACVRIIGPIGPLVSAQDDPEIQSLAGRSRLKWIEAGSASKRPPAWLFGPEQPHQWCYYFEQAALASSLGDWTRVGEIQGEVARLGLQPNDPIEWLPFLGAQAFLGNVQAVNQIAARINSVRMYRPEACDYVGAVAAGYELSPEMHAHVTDLFCRGSE